MITDHRIYLTVPFPHKQQAKSLGAKWDQAMTAWWIPDTIDSTPFQRWLQSPISAPAICFEPPAHRTADLDFLEYALTFPALTVFFAPRFCWRCTKESWVIFPWCHQSDDIESGVGGDLSALLWPEMLPALPDAWSRLHIPATVSVKNRFNRTTGTAQFSQGCAHCDALFGDFFLHEYWHEVWSARSMQEFTYQASLPWPVHSAIAFAAELRAAEQLNDPYDNG